MFRKIQTRKGEPLIAKLKADNKRKEYVLYGVLLNLLMKPLKKLKMNLIEVNSIEKK